MIASWTAVERSSGDREASVLGNLLLYLSIFLPHWWPILSAGGLLGIDAVCQRHWAWGKRQLDRIPAPRRQQLEFGILFLAVFYAGYAAWSDEHASRLAEGPYHQNVLYWEPLTSNEISSLRAKLVKITPEPVIIACETPNCKNLAESFGTAFREADWQDVKFIFHGGLGITGAYGLAVNPGDEQTAAIIEAIESTTTLKVQPPSYMRNQIKADPGVFFVIGSKPF